MKKGLYTLLAGTLLVSSFPVIAFGEEEASVDSARAVDTTVSVALVESGSEGTESVNEVPVVIEEHGEEQLLNEETVAGEAIVEEEAAIESVEEAPLLEEAEAIVEEIIAEEATPAVESRATSPNLGIEIPDYDGKLVDHDKTITADTEDAKVSGEYAFMPQITSDTEVTVTGNYSVNSNGSYVFYLANNQQGKITITYKNVGSYDGKVIDLKISFDAWTLMGVAQNGGISPRLTLHPTSTGIVMYGLTDLTANYFFLDHLTGLAAPVSGFFNFTDIDNNQFIDIYNNGNIKNFYTSEDNMLYYQENGTYIRIGDYTGTNQETDNKDYWLTYTYDKTSQFKIVFHEPRESIGGHTTVFEYTYEAPVVIESQPEANPEKQGYQETMTFIASPVVQSLNHQTPVDLLGNEQVNSLPATGEESGMLMLLSGLLIASFAGFFLKKEHLAK